MGKKNKPKSYCIKIEYKLLLIILIKIYFKIFLKFWLWCNYKLYTWMYYFM